MITYEPRLSRTWYGAGGQPDPVCRDASRDVSRNLHHLAQRRAPFGEGARDFDDEQHAHQSAPTGDAPLVLGDAAVVADDYLLHLTSRYNFQMCRRLNIIFAGPRLRFLLVLP